MSSPLYKVLKMEGKEKNKKGLYKVFFSLGHKLKQFVLDLSELV
ncbi:hypothetical protein STFR1_40034 [Bacillus vallismortis]